MTRTIRIRLAYDGSSFRGWASQRDPSIRTVEGALIGALSPVLGGPVKLSVAGRTDAGVHARNQVVSFTTDARVPALRLRGAINARLGPDVACWEAADAPQGFDARFSASAREYRYRIDSAPIADPFVARFAWHHPSELDLSAMRAAAACLIGERDFRSFCRHPGEGKATVRNLHRITVAKHGNRVELGFRANAFLHHMVRTLTVTLVRVGDGKLRPGDVAILLAAQDRTAVRGNLAPAHGLTLERVVYGRRIAPTLTAARPPR